MPGNVYQLTGGNPLRDPPYEWKTETETGTAPAFPMMKGEA